MKTYNPKTVTVPDLEIDKLHEQHGHLISAKGRIERRIVAALCAHLQARGFEMVNVYDGEETTAVSTAKEAMELIFNLDEASLRFRRVYGEGTGRTMDPRVHGVFLVLGNGEDIVSDWNYSTGDPDGFNTAMEAFDPTELL